MAMSRVIALTEFDARFGTFTDGGLKVQSILMKCPRPECGHWITIPFSDTGGNTPGGRPIWKKTGGSTLENITLAPSYYLPTAKGGCGLHGFVRNGCWVG